MNTYKVIYIIDEKKRNIQWIKAKNVISAYIQARKARKYYALTNAMISVCAFNPPQNIRL